MFVLIENLIALVGLLEKAMDKVNNMPQYHRTFSLACIITAAAKEHVSHHLLPSLAVGIQQLVLHLIDKHSGLWLDL